MTQQPVSSGTLPNVNFPMATPYAYLVLGFLLAAKTRQYQFRQFDSGVGPNGADNYHDEFDWLWVGDNAYSACNDDNANFKAAGFLNEAPSFRQGVTSLRARKGDAVPVTVLVAKTDRAGISRISARFPGGSRHQEDLKGF